LFTFTSLLKDVNNKVNKMCELRRYIMYEEFYNSMEGENFALNIKD